MKTYPEINDLTLSEARAALHLAQLNRPALTDDARAELDNRITAINDRIRRLEKTGERIAKTQGARTLRATPYTGLIVWRQTGNDASRPTCEHYRNQQLNIMVIATSDEDAAAAAHRLADRIEKTDGQVFEPAPGTTRTRHVHVHFSALITTVTDSAAVAVLRADIYDYPEALQCF